MSQVRLSSSPRSYPDSNAVFAQVWYVGVVGGLIGGPFGSDIGFEMSGAFAAVTYPVCRYLELKYVGR